MSQDNTLTKACTEYEGDSAAIWSGDLTEAQVEKRLGRFPGVSKKKSAFAVLNLSRDRGLPIRGMDEVNVACDCHVRRVFLRSAAYPRRAHIPSIEVKRTRRRYGALAQSTARRHAAVHSILPMSLNPARQPSVASALSNHSSPPYVMARPAVLLQMLGGE